MREHMIQMNKRYDLHICGEGGEFESFVRDCPIYKQRIRVNGKVIIHSKDDVAPVAYLKFEDVSLIEKVE